MRNPIIYAFLIIIVLTGTYSCKPKNMGGGGGAGSSLSSDAAQKVYVAPGKYDEFYNIVSGGFNGQMAVYGLPSGRLLRIIPVFFGFSGEWLWFQ